MVFMVYYSSVKVFQHTYVKPFFSANMTSTTKLYPVIEGLHTLTVLYSTQYDSKF